MLVTGLFGTYLMAVLYTVFFPIPIPGNWPHNLNARDTLRALDQINLIPFRYSAPFLSSSQLHIPIVDIAANVLLTIPAGIALPYLASFRAKSMLIVVPCAGLVLEGLELLIKISTGTFFHTVDINDVIMNALGILIGYLFLRIIRRVVTRLAGDFFVS
jgi:glycopeptide antibiotics resistance protein